MDQERDTVVFTDEDGNDVVLEVIDYFFYNGEEYAVLTDQFETDSSWDDIGDEEANIFFVKVVPVEGSEDEEEFVPVEDEALSDKLYEVFTADLDAEEDGE